MAKPLRNAPTLLLIAALLAAAAMILALTWHYTFLLDTWEFLMNRRDFSAEAILEPHNEHIVVIPVLIQQLFLHAFGMDTAKPEIVLLTVSLLVTACLLFVYLSRRVGSWLALFGTVLVLCLGPAWELMLWPFEISLIGSVLFGLAMLLALERGDRRGDLLACLFLALALGCSTLGIPFAVAALVVVLQSPRERWAGRAFVFLVPVALYGLWYLGWGHEAESHVSVRNVLTSPRYVAEAMAIGVGNLFGLGTNPVDGMVEKIWGAVLLVLLSAGLAYRQWGRPIDPRFWPVAAAAAANWFLTAFNQMVGRVPASSRYQYASCIFLLLLGSNLLSGARVGRRGVILGAAVTALAIAPNLIVLEDGSDFFDRQTVFTRADTGAIEIARRTVDPEFQLGPEVAGAPGLVDVFAGPYLEAVDEYGSPAYTPAELETAAPEARRQADIVLARALPLSRETQRGLYDSNGAENCIAIRDGRPREVRIDPGPTRIEVAPGPDADFALRRFATGEYPVTTAGAPGNSTTILRVPRDEATQPWYLRVEASQGARVCR